MPAIMPPINPNIIAALGQYFGGMQNRTIRTPPFVKPGGMAQRGEVLGRPSMPTPGMPQTMPQPVGGPAPTAPGVAPPPRSLGDELANIPKQPTLIPRGPAAEPVEQHPGSHLDPNTLPDGFSEIKDDESGGRKLVSPEGVEYAYDQGGDLIKVDAPRGVTVPPLPGSAAPAAAQGAAPPEEDTPRAATQRGMKVYQNPLGGRVEEDTDGTRYVYDKDGKLINRINPPGGSPVTGTQPGGGAQAPASMPQKKGGIWSRLTDPSLAGIALAAGQQMTRARYPGESGIGNAVNAVTAGYNTLAQQRQMQVAREEAARKARLEEREQARKESGTTSENAQRTAQNERWKAMSDNEKRKYDFDKDKWIAEKGFKERELGYKGREVTTGETNAASLKAQREAQARTDEQRVAALETQVDISKQELAARIKENATDNERADAELRVHQGTLALNQAKEQRDARKSMDEKFLPYYIEASNDVGDQERSEATAAAARGKPYVIDPLEHKRKVDSRAIDLINKNQAIGTRRDAPAGAPPPWAKDTDYWDQTTNEVSRQGPDGKWYTVPPPRR